MADLVEGNIGLMKAVKRFNPEVGVDQFAAGHWIKLRFTNMYCVTGVSLRLQQPKHSANCSLTCAASKKRLGWFNNGEVETVAHELGVEPSEVREMESRLAAQDATFEAPMDDDEGGSAYTAPVYYLEDKASDVAETVEAAFRISYQ